LLFRHQSLACSPAGNNCGPELEVLAKNDLGGYKGNNDPSPAVANGRLHGRDAEPVGEQALLYCIGKK